MSRFTSSTPSGDGDGDGRPTSNDKLSVIAVGATVNGEIDSQGVVKVEGVVKGSVRAAGQVLVAAGGLIDGNVHSHEAIIGGEVRGGIFGDERVEIQTGAVVQGDIATKRLLVQEGGEVNGYLKMGEPKGAQARRALARGDGAAASKKSVEVPRRVDDLSKLLK
ncbi:MAG: polymer-forming cytoskeletal protein [Gemmatimonadales bacterium]